MSLTNNKCTICRSELVDRQQQIKIKDSSSFKSQVSSLLFLEKSFCPNKSEISHWKLFSVECLCMLFGLPLNHSMISSLLGKTINGGSGPLLCHVCLEHMGNVHFVFWQLHNLEQKLVNLQKVMYKKLSSNWESAENVSKEEEVVKSLFGEIKSEKDSWPKGIYISRWKEASEYIEMVVNPHSFVGDDLKCVKVEFDECENSPVNPMDFDESCSYDTNNEDDNYSNSKEDDSDSDYDDERGGSRKKTTKQTRNKSATPALGGGEMVGGEYLCTADPDICNRTYSSIRFLNMHVKEYHAGRTHLCDQDGCAEKFLSEKSLSWHRRRVHGIGEKIKSNRVPRNRTNRKASSEIKRTLKYSYAKSLDPKAQFLCTVDPEICNRKWRTRSRLNLHIKEYHEGRTHVCDHEGCDEKFFLSEKNLFFHMRNAHGIWGERIKPSGIQTKICPEDEMSVKTEQMNSTFVTTSDPEAALLCIVDPDICTRTYKSVKFLNMHIKEYHEGRTHICDQKGCVDKFLSEKSLLIHKKRSHGMRVPRKRTTIEKIEEATGENPNPTNQKTSQDVCHICGVTTSRRNLQTHLQTFHLGFGKFPCELCSMDFTNSEDWTSHQNLHSQVLTTFPFTCVAPDCGMVLSSTSELKAHVQTHHMSNGVKCEICGKMKQNEFLLKRHMLIHRREKNKICNLCGQGFYSAGLLTLHKEKIHMGKKYSCDVCGESVTSKKSLKRHMGKHASIKPLKCALCPKTFNLSHNLAAHEETHSGRKKYECHLCGKGFKQSQNLRQHLTKGAHRPKPEQD